MSDYTEKPTSKTKEEELLDESIELNYKLSSALAEAMNTFDVRRVEKIERLLHLGYERSFRRRMRYVCSKYKGELDLTAHFDDS